MEFQGFLDALIRMGVLLYDRPPNAEEVMLSMDMSTTTDKNRNSSKENTDFLRVGLLRKELPISMRIHLFLKETAIVDRARSIRKTVGGRNHSSFVRIKKGTEAG